MISLAFRAHLDRCVHINAYSADRGTCIIHQNEAGPLWLTSLLLNIVIVSLSSNVLLLKGSMYHYLIKFFWLFFKPLHHCSFHFFIKAIYQHKYLSTLQTHERRFKRQTLYQWQGNEKLLHFTLGPYLIFGSVKQGGIKYHYWVFGMTGLNPGLLDHCQTLYPLWIKD